MPSFQFILVGVAALCMVGCVLVPPTSAVPIAFGRCTEPGQPRTLNITGVDVTPYPTELGGEARIVVWLRTDNSIHGGRISLFQITQSSPVLRFSTFCPDGCYATSFGVVINLSGLTGQRFIVRILNQERYGDCIYFDTRGGNLTLKPEVIPTANPAAITVTAI